MIRCSLRYFKQVLSVVSQFNVTEETCLAAIGLSAIPETKRVDSDIVAHVLRFAAKHLDDEMIGIKCGLKYPILQYNRPAEFLKFCENIEHAMRFYKTYCALFHTIGTPTEILSEGGEDRMVWVPNIGTDKIEDYRQLIELIMTNYVTSINWLSWKTPNAVRQLNMRHEAVFPISAYENMLGCEVRFGQSDYSVILKSGVKDTRFSTADETALTQMKLKLDLALNELRENDNFIDRVELHIRRAIEYGVPNKSSIAKSLGLSERSITRALADEGTNFKDVKSRVLRDLAVAKISEGLSLAEVAHFLGYNDQSAFTRAYKKWFGYPPGKNKNSTQQ